MKDKCSGSDRERGRDLPAREDPEGRDRETAREKHEGRARPSFSSLRLWPGTSGKVWAAAAGVDPEGRNMQQNRRKRGTAENVTATKKAPHSCRLCGAMIAAV